MSNKFPFIANEFSEKRVLVTGGTAGIGKAVISRLLNGGASHNYCTQSDQYDNRSS